VRAALAIGSTDARSAASVVYGVEHLTARSRVCVLQPDLRCPPEVEAEQFAAVPLHDEHRVATMGTRSFPPVIGRRHGFDRSCGEQAARSTTSAERNRRSDSALVRAVQPHISAPRWCV
jgi:hypothetical protein